MARTTHAEKARENLRNALRPRHINAWRDLLANADIALHAQLSRYGMSSHIYCACRTDGGQHSRERRSVFAQPVLFALPIRLHLA